MNEIRTAIEQSAALAPTHELPASAEVWSRLQFRLAYRPPRPRYLSQTGTLVTALYVLAFLVWATGSGRSCATMLVVLASAALAAILLLRRASQFFRS